MANFIQRAVTPSRGLVKVTKNFPNNFLLSSILLVV